MKALTLRQPWATLVALGIKTIETRTWMTGYRGPLAIHAGVKPFGTARLPLGRVLAIVELVDVVPVETLAHLTGQLPFGDFTPGRWGWILSDPQPLHPPPRADGRQGLWSWHG